MMQVEVKRVLTPVSVKPTENGRMVGTDNTITGLFLLSSPYYFSFPRSKFHIQEKLLSNEGFYVECLSDL
ncbi:hypothetical protein CEXT_415611 [Caerostris extrusa]|uniref:Uncharacterized protein n=1 Tax=Caerostris extrusa TaxID=172846 RepID=A0AAV4S5F2_CAEEX|nr:hypothetical protein CEXT_415611 [Caerostris extrusa]